MSGNQWLTVISSTLPLAAIYALIALAWVFIYRATGMLNFATGSYVALAAFLMYSLVQQAGLPYGLALVLAVLIVALLAALVYLAVLRPLAGQHVFSPIVVTIGISIILTAVMSIVWGTGNTVLPGPVADKAYSVGQLYLTRYGIALIAVSLAMLAAALTFLRFSRVGIHMRATAENSLLASQRGINIGGVFAMAFAVAGISVALGGVGAAQTSALSPDLATLGLRAIAPALIGGMDSVGGALAGALVVAFIESFAVTEFGGTSRDIAVFLTLLVALVVRPYGLFGTAEVRRV
jgi:branched-chain amino acid transport system permease protein